MLVSAWWSMMEGRLPLLFFFLFPHIARRGCLASVGIQQPVEGAEGDQVLDGSTWIPYIWDIDRDGHHYGPALPLARPRQRQENDEPELLYAVWESLPILAKEGLTEEEAGWVPDGKPLQTIKENYVFGSREFDHHFGLAPHPTLGHTAPHPPPPPPHKEVPTPHIDIATPDTPAPAPHTDIPTPHTDAPTPHTSLHNPPFPSHHLRPLNYVLPLQRRPRKYFLAGGEEDKHKHVESLRSGPFRKYYIHSDSKDDSEDSPYTPPRPEQPLHPHFFPTHPPLAYPPHHHPRPPPTVRQYFLQPPADKTSEIADITSFEVYEKLRNTRMVDTQEARAWVMSGVPKATSWVSFGSSSSSGHHHP